MEIDFLVIGRIFLIIISVFFVGIIFKIKISKRIGNEFFFVMIIFWSSIIIISINPTILDAVLNNTGFVNRSQFLLSMSITIIAYLLIYQTRKSKSSEDALNKMIRKIALDSFIKDNKNEEKRDIIILIAAKNEEKTIGTIIKKIQQLEIKRSHKILVVNDGSSDKTEEIVKENGCLIVNHFHNIGVGGATKTGFLACRILDPEIVVTIDADGQHDPKYIPIMIKKIEEGADMIYGSRFAEDSNYSTSSIRLVGNKFYTKLVNRIGKISITDVTSGYRAMRFKHLSKIYYRAETNFSIELALRAARNNMKISEIPTIAHERIQGKSQLYRIEEFFLYNMNAILQIINAYYLDSGISKE